MVDYAQHVVYEHCARGSWFCIVRRDLSDELEIVIRFRVIFSAYTKAREADNSCLHHEDGGTGQGLLSPTRALHVTAFTRAINNPWQKLCTEYTTGTV